MLKQRSIKKKKEFRRFNPDADMKIGYLTMTGREIVKAKLEIKSYPLTVYGVFDQNTGKVWCGGFHTEKDAELALETIKSGEVQYFRRMMDLDTFDDEVKAEKLKRFKDGLKGR